MTLRFKMYTFLWVYDGGRDGVEGGWRREGGGGVARAYVVHGAKDKIV